MNPRALQSKILPCALSCLVLLAVVGFRQKANPTRMRLVQIAQRYEGADDDAQARMVAEVREMGRTARVSLGELSRMHDSALGRKYRDLIFPRLPALMQRLMPEPGPNEELRSGARTIALQLRGSGRDGSEPE